MPVDRRIIEDQLTALGEADRWWSQKEMRDLPLVLDLDERIHALATGSLILRPRRTRKWLVLVTSQRIICLRSDDRDGRRQLDIALADLSSAATRAGLRSTRLILVAGPRKYRIRLSRQDASRLLAALTELGATMPRRGYAFQYRAFRAPLPWGAMRRVQLVGSRSTPRAIAAPAVDLLTRAELVRVEDAVSALENDVRRLQQQVEFLEQLLDQRAGALPVMGELPR